MSVTPASVQLQVDSKSRPAGPRRIRAGAVSMTAQRPHLTIGQLAALAGVRTSALRYYEAIGLLRPAGRQGARRWYDEAGLRRLAAIGLWQQAGLRLVPCYT